MNWYDESKRILKDNFQDKCIDYLSNILYKETKLENFLKMFEEWENELRIRFMNYQLEGVHGWSIDFTVNEFVYNNEFGSNLFEYLTKIILLDDFYTFSKDKTHDLKMIFKSFYEEKTSFEYLMDFFNDIESYTYIDEDAFLNEMTDYVNKSYKKFVILNQKHPAREKYRLSIEPQYRKFNDFLSFLLNSIKEKKIFARINELGNDNDATVRYFLKTNDRVYTIRVGDFL